MSEQVTDKAGAADTEADGATEPLLRVRNLKTHFHTDEGTVRAVDGIDYDVYPGECVGIVGESGSGKSVSQVSILGLIPTPPGEIVDGEIMFRGENLLEKSQKELRAIRGNQISMIWQDPMSSLNPFLKISTQLVEPLTVHQDMGRKQARERAIEMLDKVGIPGARDRIDQHPHQFSGGMRQRVMIAMALLCEPDLLIADEPTTALDVTIQAQILDLIEELRHEMNTSVIVITHDLGVVAGMAERIMVMYGGRVMEEAPARELFHHPAHPYSVGLLKSVPRIDRKNEQRLIPIEGSPPDPTENIEGCPFAPRCRWAEQQCREAFPEPEDIDEQHRSYCWRADEVSTADMGSQASADHVKAIEDMIEAGGSVPTDGSFESPADDTDLGATSQAPEGADGQLEDDAASGDQTPDADAAETDEPDRHREPSDE
jgi:oligopeptide/dipeptide ABC transporter ATP-binding protein